jgi:hypothetical protein
MVEWLERSDFDVDLTGKADTLWGYYKQVMHSETWRSGFNRRRRKLIQIERGKRRKLSRLTVKRGKRKKFDDSDDSSPHQHIRSL